MLVALIVSSITSSLKQIEESLAVKAYLDELGAVLLLARRVHFEAKHLL